MANHQPSFVSLYAGAGGLDCGFIEAGFKPLWANDFDRDAVKTYSQNLGDHAVLGDIAEVRGQLRDLAPDIVIGGPPCQGFSVAGQMRPDDPRSRHVWTFLEIVNELQPEAFVMENVKNLAINRRWSSLISSLVEFTEKAGGYRTEIFLLNASHYGVPQARERMFMVGLRDRLPKEPPKTSGDLPPTVRGALASLPPLGKPGNDSFCTARVTPARKPVLRRSPYAGMLFNGKGRPLNLDAPAPTLPASMGGNRTPIIDQYELDGRAEENWVIGYHQRLMEGRHANKRVPRRMRRLTVEEAAALQTFPPNWEFTGRQSSRFRQIGNAVPPQLSLAVARQLRRDLEATTSAESRLALAAVA